jgi:hypothetical protein
MTKQKELLETIASNNRTMIELKNHITNLENKLYEVQKQKYEPFNLEQIVIKNLKENLSTSIQKSCSEILSCYNSPLKKIMEIVLQNNSEQFKQIFCETINEILNDSLSKNEIKAELKKKIIRNLVNEATSNTDKLFEIFKNNPDLKAKLTLIITNFIDQNKLN